MRISFWPQHAPLHIGLKLYEFDAFVSKAVQMSKRVSGASISEQRSKRTSTLRGDFIVVLPIVHSYNLFFGRNFHCIDLLNCKENECAQ